MATSRGRSQGSSADRGSSLGPVLGAILLMVLLASALFALSRWMGGPETTTVGVPEPKDATSSPRRDGPGEVVSRDMADSSTLPLVEPGPLTPESNSTIEAKVEQATRRAKGIPDDVEVFELEGVVVDDGTEQPVFFYEVFLIPNEEGDVLEAAKRTRSQKFRTQRGQTSGFTLRYLMPGTYSLLVRSTEHQDFIKRGVQVPRDGALDVRLKRGTHIEGLVRDTYGKPLERMEVHLKPLELDPGHAAPRRRLVHSDSRGGYGFYRLPPGRYSLFVKSPKDPDASFEDFYLGPDQQLRHDFDVPRRTTVRMQVTNEKGGPVARARVSLISDQRLHSVQQYSDIRGEARLMFVRGGTYTLSIKAPGYRPLEEQFTVRDGDFYLQEERTLFLEQR